MHGSGRTLAGVLASLGAAAAIAAAPADARSLGAVTAPTSSALTHDGTTEIAVRVAPRARLVQARVDGRAIRLRHRRGKLRGRVRTGPGLHEMQVELRRGGHREVLQRRFAVAGRRTRLVTVAAPRRARTAPVRVRVRQNGRRLLRRLTVRLNGRTITPHFVDSSGFAEPDRLTARHGLRYGVNRLDVLAIGRSGAWDRERRRIVLRRGVPIPDAGPDRRVVAGGDVRLRSRASGPHRWRLAARPRGSRARIRGGRLVTDRPGRYRVRHAVPGSGTDVMEVQAIPDVPPLGLPIDTMATQGGQNGIQLGDQFYARQPGTTQLLEIDRATASVLGAWSYSADQLGFVGLAGELARHPYGRMFVVAADQTPTQGLPPPFGPGTRTGLNYIGLEQYIVFGGGPFSAIGVAGMPTGQGTLNQTSRSLDGALGALTGYLSLDSTGANYQFSTTDTVPFDTNTTAAGEGATAVTATVGGQPCTTTLNTPSSAGFLTLAVDAGTLETISCTGMVTLNSGNDPGNQEEMASWLERWTDQPWVLVIVQSIGHVKPTAPQWDQIADQLAALGGSEHVFNTVDGGYTLVGGAGVDAGAAAETSTTLYPDSPGPVGTRIVGVLQRNLGFGLQPSLHGSMTTAATGNLPDFTLPLLAYQPATPWPNGTSGGTGAANAYIAQQLNLQPDTSGAYDVRDNYRYENFNFPDLVSANNFTCPQDGGPGFTEADCDTMVSQFTTENQYLGKLNSYLGGQGNVPGPIIDSQSGQSDLLNAIAKQIESAVDPPSSGGTTVSWESIVEEVVDDAALVAGFVTGGEAVAGVLGFFGSTFGVAASFAKNSDGTLASTLTTDADQLALESDESFEAMLAGLGQVRDIIATDWGKLRQFTIEASGGNPAWDISDGSDNVQDAFKASAKQHYYSALLADAYVSVQLPAQFCKIWDDDNNCASSELDPTTDARTFICGGSNRAGPFMPFKDSPSDGSGEFQAVTGFNDDMTPLYTVDALGQRNAPWTMPPASLTTQLFVPPQSADDLNGGFTKPQLWRAFEPSLDFKTWDLETLGHACANWITDTTK